jgi:LysR family transcriptional regulator, nitrogen assimilation regulatory protein
MDFTSLRTFSSAAELGSLSRAATALGMAQSALSRQISTLETELGGRLFHRTGRGMQLTELGQSLLPRARALLSDAEALAQEAQSLLSTPRGLVSVGIIPYLSHPLTSQLYAAVHERYPGIRLRLYEGYSGEIENWLTSGKIDMGLFNRYRSGRGVHDALVSANIHLVMAAGDPLLEQASIRFKALANLPFVLPVRPNGLRSLLDELCLRSGIELDIQLETNSPTTIKDAVMHGGLYSLQAPNAIAHERRMGLLGGLVVSDPSIHLSTMLMATASHPLPAAAREVLRILPSLVRAVPARL